MANILKQSIANRKAKENGVVPTAQLGCLEVFGSDLVNNDVLFVNCSSVRSLNMGNVIVNQAILEKIFHGCPLIEEIKLHSFEGKETIKFFNLPNLKTLEICTTQYQTVYVDAEGLELMIYKQISSPNVLVIKSAPKLKILKLSDANITSADFCNLFANCPILEELTLQNCDQIEQINVSSHSLRFLSIIICRGLMEVKIDAPNLNMFEYHGHRVLSPLCFANGGYEKSKSSVTLYWIDDDPEEAPSFLELSEFLTTLKHTDSILLEFWSTEISYRNLLGDLRDEKNKPEFEEVHLGVSSPSSTFSAIMEGLLWSFSPKVISLKHDLKGDDEFIVYLCNELLVRRDDYLNISASASNCWRNYFKRAKLSDRDDDWRPLHSWNSLAQVFEDLGDQYTLKLSRD